MPAPYRISCADRAGCTWSHSRDHLREAIELALLERATSAAHVEIYGDSYDVDCDERGYHMCDDGLNDVERELIDAAFYRPPLGRTREVPVAVCTFGEIRSSNMMKAMQP